MSLLAALRTVVLNDARAAAALGGAAAPRWYPGQAPAEERDPCLVVSIVTGNLRQTHAGVTGREAVVVQLDAWAEGEAGEQRCEELGRAVLSAVIAGCRARRVGDTWLRAAVVRSTHGPAAETLEELGTPAWRWRVEVEVTYRILPGGGV